MSRLTDLFSLLRHSALSPSRDALSSVSWQQQRMSVLWCVGAGVRHACRVPRRSFFSSFTRDPVWNTYVRGYAVVSFARNTPHTLSLCVFFPCLRDSNLLAPRRCLAGDIGSRYVFIDALIGGACFSSKSIEFLSS